MRCPALAVCLLLAACASTDESWNWRPPRSAERATDSDAGRWAPAATESASRWTKDVDPSDPRPACSPSPWWRPECALSLNGPWQFREARAEEAPPFGARLDELVLVPFVPASSLSGLRRAVERAWYRRTFVLPESWGSERVLLHFGAVAREARVWVDGVEVGVHMGTWDTFEFDVTEAVLARGIRGEHEIVVGVRGPTTSVEPSVPTAGIWQSVWIENVPRVHVTGVEVVPHPESATLHVRVHVTGTDERVGVRVRVDSFEATHHCEASGVAGETITLDPRYSRRWTRDDPFGYMLAIELAGGAGSDRVALWTCIPDAEPRAWLRGGERIGCIDRGCWSDGLATAPTSAALHESDRWNVDFVRKSGKVEESNWYGVSESGLRILQDLPPPIEDRAQYEVELRRIVAQLRLHPRLVAWVIPEVGLGAIDPGRARAVVRELDPVRPILDANGWIDVETGEAFAIRMQPAPRESATESGMRRAQAERATASRSQFEGLRTSAR